MPFSVSAAETRITASPQAFLNTVFQRIERIEGTATLSFFSEREGLVGEVLATRGLVGLVKLAEGQIRLGERLEHRNPETAGAVRRALVQVRSEGRPLGDVLISLGAAESARIRQALLDQICDGLMGLAELAPDGLHERELPARADRIPSILSTFAPVDLYWRSTLHLAAAVDDVAAHCFRMLARRAGEALLFACDGPAGRAPLPIAAVGNRSASMDEILRLWVPFSAFATAGATGDGQPQMILLGSVRRSLLCVSTGARFAVLAFPNADLRASALGEARRIVFHSDRPAPRSAEAQRDS